MDQIAIVGKPNSGKSLLFNRLTGLRQKVSNFPGITVEVKKGQVQSLILADFPGIYTFEAMTKDEVVSVKKFVSELENNNLKLVICVLDATKLAASLRLGLEVQYKAAKSNVPVLFAMNMMDVIDSNNLKMDFQGLQEALGAHVIPVSAKTGFGFDTLKQAMLDQQNVRAVDSTDFYNRSQELAKQFGPQTDVLFLRQSRFDRIFLSPIIGVLAFVLIMLVLFQAIFTWATPFMDFVEWVMNSLGATTAHFFPQGMVRDFVADAIFGGIGSFLVFVPQIFFLTLIVGFLEDSGYLARAAMICHRPLKWFGLSGKSFIPLLTGHACAIPAIFATRAVESPRRRLMTILAVPLMSCSARLPVYALLIAAFIPQVTVAGGLLGLQGLAFFALYLFGIVMALLVTALLSRTPLNQGEDAPFLLELPPYRLPHWQPLLSRSLNSCWQFISKAGAIIFVVTVVVWILGYFPGGAGHMESSWLASMGHWLEPILQPMGLNWKYGVAILASFLAREVFVGTLGTMFGIEGAEENMVDLVENIQNSGLTMASGVSLLVFYVIALQCVSTLAVMKKELGSYKIPTLVFVSYGLMAYLCSLIAYQIFS